MDTWEVAQSMENKNAYGEPKVEGKEPKGFWDSLAGLITKITALIVAVTALIALFVHNQAVATHEEIKPQAKPPYVQLMVFRFAGPNSNEFPLFLAKVSEWLVSHKGTIEQLVAAKQLMGYSSVTGHVEDYTIEATCGVELKICALTAAGPDEQKVSDVMAAFAGL